MVPLINKRKEFQDELYQRILGVCRLQQWLKMRSRVGESHYSDDSFLQSRQWF